MKAIKVNPTFVRTKNVRNFEVMMDGLALGEGEGRLGLVYGQAGRGKTRTSQWYMANSGCVYLRVVKIWKTNYTDFLQALCRELGIKPLPKRKGACFTAAVDRMIQDPKPVFIDELEKLPFDFMDIIRDLSDISTAPFILIGEEELVSYMSQNRRVWSRTYQRLEFEPISASDIIFYCQEATRSNGDNGIKLSPEAGDLLFKASSGDFRIVRRSLLNLAQICNAKKTTEVSLEMVKIAIKTGLGGLN